MFGTNTLSFPPQHFENFDVSTQKINFPLLLWLLLFLSLLCYCLLPLISHGRLNKITNCRLNINTRLRFINENMESRDVQSYFDLSWGANISKSHHNLRLKKTNVNLMVAPEESESIWNWVCQDILVRTEVLDWPTHKPPSLVPHNKLGWPGVFAHSGKALCIWVCCWWTYYPHCTMEENFSEMAPITPPKTHKSQHVIESTSGSVSRSIMKVKCAWQCMCWIIW